MTRHRHVVAIQEQITLMILHVTGQLGVTGHAVYLHLKAKVVYQPLGGATGLWQKRATAQAEPSVPTSLPTFPANTSL